MHHFVYKITNNVNGMIYIGVHSTKLVDDGYMGSGTLLKKDIKKYGVDAFEREILYNFSTREEALLKESEIVTYDFIKNHNVYNLVLGGGIGVRSVKEKRHLFSKRAKKVNITEKVKIPYLPVDKDYFYVIKPKIDYPKFPVYSGSSKLSVLLSGFMQDNIVKFYQSLSYCYNNSSMRDLALKGLSKANQYVGFYDNWKIIKHNVDQSFWDKLNDDNKILSEFY